MSAPDHRIKPMNRRQALRSIALGGAGATAVPGWVARLGELAERRSAVFHAAQRPSSPVALTPAQFDAVATLAELIIPRTDTAGATDADVAGFIDTVLDDAPQAERQEFLRGLAWVDDRSRERFGSDFTGARPAQQEALLREIATADDATADDAAGVTFFQAMKQLTVTGYYTSEPGMREELGDTGNLFFADDPGCGHPEHKS
jgi:hypothetical protein